MPTRKPARTAAAPSGAPAGWTDRFSGKLVLVLLDNKYTPSVKKGRSLWGLQRPLAYRPSNGADTVTVPAGFVTDLTSIPRLARSIAWSVTSAFGRISTKPSLSDSPLAISCLLLHATTGTPATGFPSPRCTIRAVIMPSAAFVIVTRSVIHKTVYA